MMTSVLALGPSYHQRKAQLEYHWKDVVQMSERYYLREVLNLDSEN